MFTGAIPSKDVITSVAPWETSNSSDTRPTYDEITAELKKVKSEFAAYKEESKKEMNKLQAKIVELTREKLMSAKNHKMAQSVWSDNAQEQMMTVEHSEESEVSNNLKQKHPDDHDHVENKTESETTPPVNIKQEPQEEDEEDTQISLINKVVNEALLNKDSQKFDYKHYLTFVVPKNGKWPCKICSKEYKGVSMKNHIENIHHEIVRNYFLFNVQYNNKVEVVEYMDEDTLSSERRKKRRKKHHAQAKTNTKSFKYSDHEDYLPDEVEYKKEPKYEFGMLVDDEEDDDFSYIEPFDYSIFGENSGITDAVTNFENNEDTKAAILKTLKMEPSSTKRQSIPSNHKTVDGKPFCEKHKMFFKSVDMLRKHNLDYHKIKESENPDIVKVDMTEKCHLCEIDFETYNLFRAHMKQFHRKDDKYTCPQCGIDDMPDAKNFPLASFVDHLALEHGIGPIPFKVCDTCQETFHSNIKYLKHTKTSHREKKPPVAVFCDQCGKNFLTRSGLTNHVKNFHSKRILTAKDCVKKCVNCNAEFDHPQLFDSHLKVCIGVHKDFRCKFCESFWVSHLSLELHVMVHHGKLKFACDECGKLYDTVSHANYHKRIDHENAHACVCHVCAKTFATKPRLKRHLQWAHDIGEKKFKCEQCDLRFVSKHALSEHFDKVHDTENVYPCDQCPKTFQVKSYLMTHIRIVLRNINHAISV